MQKWMMLSAMLCLLLGTSAQANTWSNDCCSSCHFQSALDFDVGYRWDKLGHLMVIWDETTEFTDAVPVLTRHINSVQVGLSGIWAPCCTDWYLRAEGHYSSVVGGKHGSLYIVRDFRGDIKNGHMWDFNAAVGYLFDINCCWGVAPVVGWSYDRFDQKIDLLPDPHAFSVPVDIRTKNRFQGPFIGFDTLVCLNPCTQLIVGYELHWAEWRGSNTFNPELLHNDNKKHNNFWGNVFKVEGIYAFTRCWNLGLELKYQNWKASGFGHLTRDGPRHREQLVTASWWQSFSALLKMGYNF